MTLKDHNYKPGFLLLEVLLAVGISSAALSAVYFMKDRFLRSLMRHSDVFRVSLSMKNFLTEKTWRTQFENKVEEVFEQRDKITGLSLKYTRTRVTKDLSEFKKKIDEKQLKNLYLQKVETRLWNRVERMYSFLYKIDQSDS